MAAPGFVVEGTQAPGRAPVAQADQRIEWEDIASDADLAAETAARIAGDNADAAALAAHEADTTNVHGIADTARMARTNDGVLEDVDTVAASGAAVTVDLEDGNVHEVTLTAAAVALTLAGATNGKACSLTLILHQDGVGGRAVTWPATVDWNEGAAPVLSTAAGATDIVTLLTVDGGARWYAFLAGKGMA